MEEKLGRRSTRLCSINSAIAALKRAARTEPDFRFVVEIRSTENDWAWFEIAPNQMYFGFPHVEHPDELLPQLGIALPGSRLVDWAPRLFAVFQYSADTSVDVIARFVEQIIRSVQ